MKIIHSIDVDVMLACMGSNVPSENTISMLLVQSNGSLVRAKLLVTLTTSLLVHVTVVTANTHKLKQTLPMK